MKGKIKNYILNHKIRLLILLVLLIGSVVFAMFSLNSTYNYVIDQYENGHDNIQVCEDGITTLNRMRYYRNSQNYIRQMKRSIIEDYCNIGQFEEAKNYLDRNYEIGDWAGVPRPAVTRNGTGEFVGPSARWAAGMSSPLGSTLQRLRRRDVKNPMH